MTQYNKRYILSTLEKIEIFALSNSNRRFKKLSNYTKLIKIEVILLKIKVYQVRISFYSLYILHTVLFSISEYTWPTRCTFCCTGSHTRSHLHVHTLTNGVSPGSSCFITAEGSGGCLVSVNGIGGGDTPAGCLDTLILTVSCPECRCDADVDGDTPGCLDTLILTASSGCPAYRVQPECSCDSGVGADADDDDDTADGLDVGICTASGRPESASIFFNTAPGERPRRRNCGNNSGVNTGECNVDTCSAFKV